MNGRTGDEMFISRFLLGYGRKTADPQKEDNRKQKHLAAANDLIEV